MGWNGSDTRMGALAFGALLSLSLSQGLSLIQTARAAQPMDLPLELCRVRHGKSSCIRANPQCSPPSVLRLPNGEEAPCAPASPQECQALVSLLKEGVRQVAAMPNRERKLASATLETCDGYRLRSGPWNATACIGTHREGARLLHQLHGAAELACNPQTQPKTRGKAQ